MPRKLTDERDYPTAYRGQVIRLAEVTVQKIADLSWVTHYFATEETDWAGNHYLPGLVVDQAIQYYRSQQADAGSLKLQNVDGSLETLLASERWQGGRVRMLEYFTALPEGQTGCCELIRGLLGPREADENFASWSIIPGWDPQAIAAPARVFSRPCTWRFKSNQCGYSGGLTTCPHTYAACTTRGQTHRFNGFLQVNSTLEKVYPAPPPAPPRGTPGRCFRPW